MYAGRLASALAMKAREPRAPTWALVLGVGVLDVLLMHPNDLALWPHSTPHLGFGLWTSHPPFWWFFEAAFIAACLTYYVVRARRLRSFGGRAWAVVLVIAILHVVNSPWLAPTK